MESQDQDLQGSLQIWLWPHLYCRENSSAGITMEMSEEAIEFDIEKEPRLKNWRYRLNNLYKIIDKQGQLITFKENVIQELINNCKRRRKMILKARQFGVTTMGCLKMLDYVIFNKNKSACLIANERGNMEKIFEKIRLAYEQLHPSFKPELAKGGGSKYELKFPALNSKIYCTLEVRGGTNHWLHSSETAFTKAERLKATLETVPMDTGIVTEESTANGMGGHFYKKWNQRSNFTDKLFFPWYLFPQYRLPSPIPESQWTADEKELAIKAKRLFKIKIDGFQIAFRRAKQEDLKELFWQEYAEDDASCFLASGAAAMDNLLITELMEKAPEPIEDTGTLKIFEPYDSHKSYAVGADTAEGRGGDYSVGTVFDVRTRREVAQIRSNMWKPSAFAIELDKLCKMYQKPGRGEWPLLGVERNNHGHAVLQYLDEILHYPNLYHFKEDVPGWKTDSVTRPVMIDTFIDGVENGTIELQSQETLGECLTLIDNNGKIEAEEGENDDTIISAAIGVQMCIESAGDLDLYDDPSSSILV